MRNSQVKPVAVERALSNLGAQRAAHHVLDGAVVPKPRVTIWEMGLEAGFLPAEQQALGIGGPADNQLAAVAGESRHA